VIAFSVWVGKGIDGVEQNRDKFRRWFCQRWGRGVRTLFGDDFVRDTWSKMLSGNDICFWEWIVSLTIRELSQKSVRGMSRFSLYVFGFVRSRFCFVLFIWLHICLTILRCEDEDEDEVIYDEHSIFRAHKKTISFSFDTLGEGSDAHGRPQPFVRAARGSLNTLSSAIHPN
jgi:hypothetical protein